MKLYNGDCLELLKEIENNSVDLLATDPPYGISFMGKDWDRALPDKKIWVECLRVLKDGAFAFVMSIPRADCLSRMIISLEDAGFWVNFTPIFWAYASGFPKAQNIGKAVDKRLGVEREVVGSRILKGNAGVDTKTKGGTYVSGQSFTSIKEIPIEIATSSQAKALDGSYGGFQPKPAVEVIIVAMKPLSEKTFVDQALKNKKGITWLDDGRIPLDINAHKDMGTFRPAYQRGAKYDGTKGNIKFGGTKLMADVNKAELGRFPANLLVSDDVLNDGRMIKGTIETGSTAKGIFGSKGERIIGNVQYDSGSFSRYFDLNKWFSERIRELPQSVQKTFPFLIVPKASKNEKNKGCEGLPEIFIDIAGQNTPEGRANRGRNPDGIKPVRNSHPTVKPLKLMSYLITLGSREGDIVIDPFMGTGTTGLACQLLNREFVGAEINPDYFKIAKARLNQSVLC